MRSHLMVDLANGEGKWTLATMIGLCDQESCDGGRIGDAQKSGADLLKRGKWAVLGAKLKTSTGRSSGRVVERSSARVLECSSAQLSKVAGSQAARFPALQRPMSGAGRDVDVGTSGRCKK